MNCRRFTMKDYRQIPYEQLNSNISQGRGMIKWAPFATMPEQYESVNQLICEQSLSPEPRLTDDTILINERAALQLINQTAIVRYWSSGQEVMIECEIIKLDKDTQSLIVEKKEQILNIYFYYIYEVRSGGFVENNPPKLIGGS